jgi:hypothetical protein
VTLSTQKVPGTDSVRSLTQDLRGRYGCEKRRPTQGSTGRLAPPVSLGRCQEQSGLSELALGE